MDANSALYWMPRVEALGIPAPKTKAVPYAHYPCLTGMMGEGDPAAFNQAAQDVLDACREVLKATGKDRVFIRGDHTSSKHSGPGGYRFLATDDLPRVKEILAWNIEDAEGKSWGAWVQEAFLVREWLDLEASFGAFGYGPHGSEPHPIAREFRFFADKGGVICFQPYWPPEPLEGNTKDPDWRAKLAHLNRALDDDELSMLSWWAKQAATACPAAKSWSVDFAQGTDGGWRLIDMAVASASFHYPDCPTRESPRIVGPREPLVVNLEAKE